MAKLHARGRTEKYRLVRFTDKTDEFGCRQCWSVYAFMTDGKVLGKTVNISNATDAPHRHHSTPWKLVKLKTGIDAATADFNLRAKGFQEIPAEQEPK